MRHILAVVGLLLVLVAAGSATAAPPVFDTPKALLDYAYAPYATGNFKDDTSLLYSSELNAQFAAAEAGASEDSPGPIDFDVFVNGQDYTLSKLAIADPKPEGEGVSVPVTFDNQGVAESLVFHMVKEDGGWRISDIESLTKDNDWVLTKLLTDERDGVDEDAGAAVSDAGSGK